MQHSIKTASAEPNGKYIPSFFLSFVFKFLRSFPFFLRVPSFFRIITIFPPYNLSFLLRFSYPFTSYFLSCSFVFYIPPLILFLVCPISYFNHDSSFACDSYTTGSLSCRTPIYQCYVFLSPFPIPLLQGRTQ